MVCPWCGEDRQLSPHHRKPLWMQGSNTIDNIWPLCKECHDAVHDIKIGCEGSWTSDYIGFPSYEVHHSLGRDPTVEQCEAESLVRRVGPPRMTALADGSGWEWGIDYTQFCGYPGCLIVEGDRLVWWGDV